MLIKLNNKSNHEDLTRYGIDPGKTYLVTAIAYYSGGARTGLVYYTNAAVERHGGLPVPIEAENVDIIDEYLPDHWIVNQYTEEESGFTTLITYPEWAKDPKYYEKMDENDADNMRAVNKYGEELKMLSVHYKGAQIADLSLEPFDA